MTETTELIDRHRAMTRDYIAAERAFTADPGNARTKVRLDHLREIMDELAPKLWQHQPEAKFDQIAWAEYMLKGAVVFVIRQDNVTRFRDACDRAKAILGH
jgi:hypothetical protein